jgi:hypothetical protein
MSYQGSLRSCEPIILSVGIYVPGGMPWFAPVSRHGGNQGVRAILVGGSAQVAQEVSEEARRAKKHKAKMKVRKHLERKVILVSF